MRLLLSYDEYVFVPLPSTLTYIVINKLILVILSIYQIIN